MAYKRKSKKQKASEFIRSSKTSIKFANTDKLNKLSLVIFEYKKVMSEVIEITWPLLYKDIPSLPDKSIVDKLTKTWLSARLIQCAAKQALGVVRGSKKKQAQRQFMIDKFTREGNQKQVEKLLKNHAKYPVSKPELDRIEMELDERFVSVDFESKTSFDGWITLTSLTAKDHEKIELIIPFKRTKHFRKLLDKSGKLKKGVRLSEENITFMFNFEKQENNNNKTLGIDIGVKSLFSVYDGKTTYQSQKDIHGHDLDTINDRLARRKKGSKGFQRAQEHQKNYINQQINLINFTDVRILRLEKIYHLRFGKKTSRKLQHFTSSYILKQVKSECEWNNVYSVEVNPTYTSQRCSCCGWTQKSNRKGKVFKCKICGYTDDADLNASRNIWLNLRYISREERLLRPNKKGFYWEEVSKESIVPCVRKVKEEGAQSAPCHI